LVTSIPSQCHIIAVAAISLPSSADLSNVMILSAPTRSSRQKVRPGRLLWKGLISITVVIGFAVYTMYLVLMISPTETRGKIRRDIALVSLSATKPWMGLKSDRSKKTYATVNPTGAYTYYETKECALHISNPCRIYFPMVEMSSFISRDEMLSSESSASKDHVIDPIIPIVTTQDTEAVINKEIIKKLRIPASVDEQHALLTRQGYKGSAGASEMNQDRILIVSPFWFKQAKSPPIIMGLFDGHGEEGHVTSHYAALELPRMLTNQLEKRALDSEDAVKAALSATIIEMDANVISKGFSGSTAILMLKLGRKLYVANTGDSLAFVAAYNVSSRQVKTIFQTKPHKPHLPEERERIEKAGGTITLPELENLESSRVLIPYGIDSAIALAMSRSIGDKGGELVGIIADPTVDVIDLDKVSKSGALKVFMVAATDGLFDLVNPSVVSDHLARAMYQEKSSLLCGCEQLISLASLKWKATQLQYRDDISIAVTKL